MSQVPIHALVYGGDICLELSLETTPKLVHQALEDFWKEPVIPTEYVCLELELSRDGLVLRMHEDFTILAPAHAPLIFTAKTVQFPGGIWSVE